MRVRRTQYAQLLRPYYDTRRFKDARRRDDDNTRRHDDTTQQPVPRHPTTRRTPKGYPDMPYDPNCHHRRSIRLPGYDYTRPGAYFVTICTQGRQCIFDSPALRRIAEQQWLALARSGERGAVTERVALDAWVVMPNHIHGIIMIATPFDVGAQQGPLANSLSAIDKGGIRTDPTASPVAPAAPPQADDNADDIENTVVEMLPGGLGINVAPGSLGAIVRSYKSPVARRVNALRRTPGAPVWQRGYWERVVRDERELAAVRRYIVENPARWEANHDSLDALLARMQAKE
jgi:REP-associated tyrosine transposase